MRWQEKKKKLSFYVDIINCVQLRTPWLRPNAADSVCVCVCGSWWNWSRCDSLVYGSLVFIHFVSLTELCSNWDWCVCFKQQIRFFSLSIGRRFSLSNCCMFAMKLIFFDNVICNVFTERERELCRKKIALSLKYYFNEIHTQKSHLNPFLTKSV